MKHYTVTLRLSGAVANAVAVEWTDKATPLEGGQGWEPCLRQPDGAWRFSSRVPLGAEAPHRREPGVFGNLAIRCRLTPAGPWSPASTSRKEIVIVAVTEEPGPTPAGPVAPFVLAAPFLAGSGKIGSELTVTPGFWGGHPAPQVAFQWRRNGAPIPGAVARAYVPGPADDGTDLDCAVSARNAAGAVVGTTAALRATYPAPKVFGELPEEIFDEGAGPQLVETASVFAGANLAFAAQGRPIDPRTGVVTVSTDRPTSGETVTVTATNSGGAASATLRITVEAVPPAPLEAADMRALRSVWRPEGQTGVFTPVLAFPGLAGEAVGAIEWTTSTAAVPLEQHWEVVLPRTGAAGEYELYMRDPAKRAPLAEPKVDFAVFGSSASEIGRSAQLRFRWRKAGGTWSAPSAVLGPVPRPDERETRMWRPLHLRTEEAAAKAVDHPAEYALAPYGGEGLQNSHVFVRAGKRTWFGGDMCGLRFTEDDRRWVNPRARGLRGCGFHAIGVDPDDENRVIVVASSVNQRTTPSIGDLGAIYLSTDLAHTFTKRPMASQTGTAVASLALPARITKNLSPLCHLSEAATPATRRWRMIEFPGPSGARLWRSDDGGQTWRQGPSVPAEAAAAEIYLLVPHPTVATTYFAVTSAGLWRITGDGATWTRIGAGTGKLGGSVRGLWIDPENANRMLVSQATGTPGVFYTTNGGAAAADWTQVLNATGGGISPTTLAVGPEWTENGATYRGVYVCNDASDVSHKNAWIQIWNTAGAPSASKFGSSQLAAGAAAPRGQWYLPRLVLLTDENPHWRQLCDGGGSAKFAPDPVDRTRICVFGYGLPWWSTDGGASFRPGSGYGGMNSQAMYVDPTLPRHAAIGLNDIGITMGLGTMPRTLQLGGFGDIYQEALSMYGGTTFGATGAVILPNSAALPADKRGRVILFAGDYSSDQLGLVRKSTGWEIWKDLSGVKIATTQALYRAFVDANPNYVYSGSARTTNAGDNWAVNALGGRLCCGASKQTPGLIFGSVSGGEAVDRSTNHGASWTRWCGGLNLGNRGAGFWLNPANQEMAVARASNGDLCLVRGAATGAVTLNLNLVAMYKGEISLPLVVSSVAWCPLEPRRITAFAKTFGLPQIWEGLFDADFGRIVWTDITRNFPCTSNTRDLIVHPLTGERIASCGQGIWVLPPDGALHAEAWYPDLPKPFLAPGFASL